MRYLTLGEVLYLHDRILSQVGRSVGLRDLSGLESALAQPRGTYAGQDLNPDLASKATALAFSLIMNHPFLDGNKRTGHAALETFLLLNGHELMSSVDEAEAVIVGVAAGALERAQLLEWVRRCIRPTSSDRTV